MFEKENLSPIERAFRNANASLRMEGFEITPQMELDEQRVIRGEITIEELIEEIKERYRTKVVQDSEKK